MALGREVHHRLGTVFREQRANGVAVGDIAAHEENPVVTEQALDALEMSGVGQGVEDHETVHGGGESLPDEVGADEARASGDDPGAHAHTAEAGSRFRAAAERAGTLFRKVIFGPKLSRPQDRVTIPAARHSKNRP
jgi:hypothetical protein